MSELRFAKLEDIPALVRMARDLHAQSTLSSLRFDANRVWQVLERSIGSSDRCLFVAVTGGEIVGVMFAIAEQYLFGTDCVVRVEAFYITAEYRGTTLAMRMLASLKRWADNREAAEIQCIDRLPESGRRRRLFNRLGFTSQSVLHSRWLASK